MPNFLPSVFIVLRELDGAEGFLSFVVSPGSYRLRSPQIGFAHSSPSLSLCVSFPLCCH